ncbi:hypothetical protein F5J12DRAFT_787808 [Pisolithus orientalis]|uniref:uncharacterized protein n=1 Tax=Pisolithus orientalis TaxID=936130 RepID=UPI002224B8A8|nr:uncharacterized protein F5J12DRAFT_787808 [Pisolithus orientalis]KAI5983606.1 hypothetical protein F5J12DRAFT_787808 [Pisolithus orientalis]
MSTTNTSTFIPAQSTDNIQPVITAENAKWMVEEAARVTMQALRGLQGWDAKHWGKVAQLVWAQLDVATFQPDDDSMTGQCHAGAYWAFIEGPSTRHSWWIRGRGKSWVWMRLKGFSFWDPEDAPTDTTARTTGVVNQKLGNEEDQNREKAWGHSQSRHGWPAAKPVDASDQTSRGWSQSKRPTKKVKPAVNKDVQDHSIDQFNEPNIKGQQAEINLPVHPKSQAIICLLAHRLAAPSHARSIATDPPITPAPTTTIGANDLCHCDKYQEEVTILKWENADMRQEIEVPILSLLLSIRWLLPTLHWYLTFQSWWNLALQAGVVEVQSS